MRCTCSHVSRALRPCSGSGNSCTLCAKCDACILMQGSTSCCAGVHCVRDVQPAITAHQSQHLWGLHVATGKDHQSTGYSILHIASA